jgi:hypothetical protein
MEDFTSSALSSPMRVIRDAMSPKWECKSELGSCTEESKNILTFQTQHRLSLKSR